MITPEEFPYIKSLHVNDCYAYQDFDINLHDYKPFSHLILTGKNGSGKSTILKHVGYYLSGWQTSEERLYVARSLREYIDILKRERINRHDKQSNIVGQLGKMDSERDDYQRLTTELHKYGRVLLLINHDTEQFWQDNKSITIYSYFKAKRIGEVLPVEAPSKETEFTDKFNTADSTEFYISKFRQYLVNRKVEQAFSQIESETRRVQDVQHFFNSLKDTLNKVFEGQLTDLEFNRSSYEFYLNLTDSRKLTFNTLSEGFSAFISIFMDLFIRVDLIRKQVNDYSYNPCGIVLIDEPETHLHLQLQEQVLPLLTSLFPNVQFIAATHSPAVIASIKNATIFDLTTKETRSSEDTAGRSYSDLMRGHFGLDNEYSAIADGIFRKADQLLKDYKHQPEKLRAELQQLFIENEDYLSPSFRVELESMILENA